MSAVNTGSMRFSSVASRSGTSALRATRSVSPTSRRAHIESRSRHSSSLEIVSRRISSICSRSLLSPQDPLDAAPDLAVAGREREVEIVEHACRDEHGEHRLPGARTDRLASELVLSCSRNGSIASVGVADAIPDHQIDQSAMLGERASRCERDRFLLTETGSGPDKAAERLEVSQLQIRRLAEERQHIWASSSAKSTRRASPRSPRARSRRRARRRPSPPEPIHHVARTYGPTQRLPADAAPPRAWALSGTRRRCRSLGGGPGGVFGPPRLGKQRRGTLLRGGSGRRTGSTYVTRFADLNVDQDILDALTTKGIEDSFPIQEQTIPLSLPVRT